MKHGTYFYWAAQEGLIKNGSSIEKFFVGHIAPFLSELPSSQHSPIRTTLSGPADYDNDDGAGFHRIEAREIDTLNVDGIIKKIHDTVGTNPVYLTIELTYAPSHWFFKIC